MQNDPQGPKDVIAVGKSQLISKCLSILQTNKFDFTTSSQIVFVIEHYEPKSPMTYDYHNFDNFWFSNIFLAQIQLKVSYFHMICLERLDFAIKYIVYKSCLKK